MNNNKIAILYVITNDLNDLKYYGMIHKPGKTIQERFSEHIKGIRAGKFIHRAIKELGEEHFSIREIERGDFEYISKREIEETAKCLWVKGCGYNGNTGKCILLNDEMKKKRLSNINQEEKTKRWKNTFENRKSLHNYSHSEQTKIKQEEINYSKIRGYTKDSCERLKKLSESIKKRWENPTEAMIKGIEKMKNTMKSQTKENSERIKKFVKTMKEKNRKGENAPNFRLYWITPLGKYSTAEQASQEIGIGISTLMTWCSYDKKIYKKHHLNNDKILNEWNGKTTKQIGFDREEIKNNKII